MHVSKGQPVSNATKIWLTKVGTCIVCNNNSRIPDKELNIICEDIELHYFQILEKWKIVNPGEVKFYC